MGSIQGFDGLVDSESGKTVTPEIKALLITAGSIGFIHTLLGPDHYVPFIVMSWARKWSTVKTGVITAICALGHVGSSVILGFVGVLLGLAVENLTGVESFRGRIAAWLFIAFGLAYLIWGLRRVHRSHPHQHGHPHVTGDEHDHAHAHTHFGEHVHVHDVQSMKSLTPWILFTIFVFGPCEPLIPILMYPAARGSLLDLIAVTATFGIVTAATMLATVFLGRAGVDFLPMRKVQRYSHAVAGATILLCGLAIEFLGL
jgi:ABC-type nickel/cobalt efflux system permease component RcnA